MRTEDGRRKAEGRRRLLSALRCIFHAIIILRSRRMEIYGPEKLKNFSLSALQEEFMIAKTTKKKAKEKSPRRLSLSRESLELEIFSRLGLTEFSNRWYHSSWQDVFLNHSARSEREVRKDFFEKSFQHEKS
jgi:hypothetical protein